ncbi:MAG: hypothetical protein HN891_07825 [Planctomycetes bacterium]|nr:hypothetical protein [Planctomycetota bacterium]
MVTLTDWKPRGGEGYLSPPLGLFSTKVVDLDSADLTGVSEETKSCDLPLVSRSKYETFSQDLDQFGGRVARAICSEYDDMLEL